jgi:hypothetical protein
VAVLPLTNNRSQYVSARLTYGSLSVVVRTSQPAVTFGNLERTERDLANRTQEVLNAFTHMNGAKAVVETIAKRRVFIGTLPGMGESDKREQDMLTPNAADLVPVEMPWTDTRKSPLILFETPYRQLITYSMFDPDLSDANSLPMVKSGGGETLGGRRTVCQALRPADDDSARQSMALLQCREAEGRSAA